MRRICEKYHCLPDAVETLTLDQIFLLVADEKKLERLSGNRETTVAALQAEGVIPRTPGGSLVQRIRYERRAEAEAKEKVDRRRRRAERRAEMIAKKERGEL